MSTGTSTRRTTRTDLITVLDLIGGFARGVACERHGSADQVSQGRTRIAGETLRTLFIHPPAAVTFRLPGSAIAFRGKVGIAPDVWDKDTGPCEFVIETDTGACHRTVIDVRCQPADRRWHEVRVALPATSRDSISLTLRTRGIGGEAYRWALFGEPVIEAVGDHPDWGGAASAADGDAVRIDRAALEDLTTHPDNLSFNLYRELMYWNNTLRSGDNPYVLERLDEVTLGKTACPEFLLDIVAQETRRLGRKPRVLDFGAGPFSTLVYLHKAALAEVTAVDTLSDEYRVLLESHGIAWPLIPQRASGETLSDRFGAESFDIVFVSNALDHTQAPALTWMNLFQVTRVGGVLAHRHAIREASHEHWDQLHQFDLFPRDGAFQITDVAGHEFSLSDGLPLTAMFTREFELAGFDWFETAYRKSGADIESVGFLRNALTQCRRAYARRSGFACRLEHLLGVSLDLSARFNGLPFYVSALRD